MPSWIAAATTILVLSFLSTSGFENSQQHPAFLHNNGGHDKEKQSKPVERRRMEQSS